jgi:PAS domain S-box-containing protein
MQTAASGAPDFQNLFQHLPGLFIVINPELKIITSNRAYLDKVEKRHEDIAGRNFADLFPRDSEAVNAFVRKALRQQQPESLVIPKNPNIKITAIPVLENKNGTCLLIKIDYLPESTEGDIHHTDHEDQLKKSKELFFNLFEFNPAALAISRLSDSKIIKVNESFLKLFDFTSKADVIGKTGEELRLMVEPEQRQEIINALKEKRNAVNMEGSIRTVKGNIKWTRSSILMIDLEEQPCLMAVIIDITDRKVAEEKIKNSNAELESAVSQRTKEMLETELEYRSVIEQATDAIFISDSKGRYVDVNPSACAMLGYSKNEFMEMSTADLLVPEEAVANPPRFADLINGKIILSRRNLKRKDGSIVPVEINARMLANGRMLGMVRDITERMREDEHSRKLNMQLEQKVQERTADLELKIQLLKESEEKFQKAFHASAAGITITRLSDSTYVDVNEAFLKMIGYSKEEVIGRNSTQLGLVVDMKMREEVIKEITERGSVRHLEMTVRTKSGALLEILSSIETIVHNEEKYAINIIYDITERKQAEKKLAEVNKELEAFSYSVSHDLRAPLRSISGYSQVLLEDFGETISEEGKHHLAVIRRNANKMSRLIDDLLEFSRVGKQELIKLTIDTESVVKKIIDDLTVSLTVQPEFKINTLIRSIADFSMLNQVWVNLLSNAIKYSSKKERAIIEIGSYSSEKESVFYVKDNGAGFNMEYVHKLFGVFQRLHRTTEFEGTGVGLALVKRIVEKHGGRTWAEGKINEGATFYFSLPA